MPYFQIDLTKLLRPKALLYVLLLLNCSLAFGKTDIVFWHAMNGEVGAILNALVKQFNAKQSDFRVLPIYKGGYEETLITAVAAFRGRQPPDMVQIYEVGSATMMYPSGIIVPVAAVLDRYAPTFNQNDLLAPIKRYYSDEHSRLMAWPLNVSTPLLFYNKTHFTAAGLDPEQPPKTWGALARVSKQLLQRGFSCGFTTEWPSWIQLEEFADSNGIALADHRNGFKGMARQLHYEDNLLIRHLSRLVRWQDQHIFCYGGRENDPQALFLSGVATMIMASSGGLRDMETLANFPVGIAALPIEHKEKRRHNSTLGGAAIWILRGHQAEVDKGIAQFLVFLAAVPQQTRWQAMTGYLPITRSQLTYNMDHGFYLNHPGQWLAIAQLLQADPGNPSTGRRLGNYMQIREIEDQTIEAAVAKLLSPRAALQDASRRGTRLLNKFHREIGRSF